MTEVRSLRERAGVTQALLAGAAGTSQPTIAAYEAGRKSPRLDTLHRLAEAVGLEAFIAFHRPMTREERRSLALHRVIARHLVDHPAPTLAQARATLATMTAGGSANSALLREWAVVLDRPVPAIVEMLLDPAPWARELRHTTPFAGILSPAERRGVYDQFRESERQGRR